MLFPIFSLCAGTPLVLLAQSSGSSIVAALTIATVMGVTIGGSLGVAVTFEGSEK